MKTKIFVLLAATAIIAPAALIPIQAADAMAPATPPGNDTAQKSPNDANAAKDAAARKEQQEKQELDKRVADAIAFYNSIQGRPETAIPNWVVTNCKGVVILSRWTVSAGIGGTGGSGVGWKKAKGSVGDFVGPAFYSLGGASLGVQLGVSKTQTIAFLMSDKSLLSLTDSKFLWSGNVKAVAGEHSANDSSIDNTVDVVLYQQSSGFDVGALVAGTAVSVDNDANRLYYGNTTLTPTDIFAGKVKAPESTKAFVEELKKEATTKTK